MSELEARFLTFGWSSWKTSIHPKRLQARTKHNFEKQTTRRGHRKDTKKDKKTPTEVITIIDESSFGARGSLGRTTYQRTKKNYES